MVFPLKDTMPAARVPVLTLALVVLAALVLVVAGDGGWVAPGGVLHAAATLLALWIFGATLEDTLGRATFAGLFVAGGAVAVAVGAAAAPDVALGAVAACGAVAASVGGYVALYPRGRVLSVALIPLVFTMLELPAVLLAGLWAALQVAVFAGPGAGGAALAGLAGGLVLGLAAARLLAQPKPIAPAPYRVA